MGLILTTTAALILWIVLWAIGFKSFDGFLIALGLVIVAAVTRMALPSLPGNRRSPDEPGADRR